MLETIAQGSDAESDASDDVKQEETALDLKARRSEVHGKIYG